MAGYSKLLIDAFGGSEILKEVANLVLSFDFKKTLSVDDTVDDYLHTSLAPSFGGISSAEIQKMDDNLKIMISGLMHALAKIPPIERTWDKVLSTVLQSSVLRPHPDPPISRRDSFDNVGTHAFKIHGDPDEAIVKKVEEWFSNFIKDDDVLRSTKIDIKTLAKIVAQSGATIDSIESVLTKEEKHSKTVIDIGVLRFPSLKDPYFKIYRIKLHAWSDCTRLVFVQHDANGIEGEFDCRKFVPNKDVIEDMDTNTRQKAVEQANKLFG